MSWADLVDAAAGFSDTVEFAEVLVEDVEEDEDEDEDKDEDVEDTVAAIKVEELVELLQGSVEETLLQPELVGVSEEAPTEAVVGLREGEEVFWFKSRDAEFDNDITESSFDCLKSIDSLLAVCFCSISQEDEFVVVCQEFEPPLDGLDEAKGFEQTELEPRFEVSERIETADLPDVLNALEPKGAEDNVEELEKSTGVSDREELIKRDMVSDDEAEVGKLMRGVGGADIFDVSGPNAKFVSERGLVDEMNVNAGLSVVWLSRLSAPTFKHFPPAKFKLGCDVWGDWDVWDVWDVCGIWEDWGSWDGWDVWAIDAAPKPAILAIGPNVPTPPKPGKPV